MPLVVGAALITLFAIVLALAGSEKAQRLVIAMSSLVAVGLLAILFFVFVK